MKYLSCTIAVLLIITLNTVFTSAYANENTAPETTEAAASNQTPKHESPTASSWPEKIGPFELSSPNGQSSIRFGFAAQLLFTVTSKDQGSGQDRDNTVTAEIRRLRLKLSGSVLSKDLTYYLQLSTAPRSLEFLDWFLNYRFHTQAQLRLGQWKIPFTRYRIQSDKNLTFPDWALTTKYFGAERQMGLMLHNGAEKPEAIEYEVGVFTGVNARKSHSVNIAKIYGAPIDNPSDLSDIAPKVEFHPELVWHLAYNHNNIDVKGDTDMKGGPFRFMIGLSGSWDIRPKLAYDLKFRLAPEFLMKAHGFSLSLVYYMAWTDLQNDESLDGIAMMGGIAQASYIVKKRVEFALRYAIANVHDDLLQDARSWSTSQIATVNEDLAASKISPKEANDLISAYNKAGQCKREQELSFGINTYIIGSYLKWQNDVTWKKTTTQKIQEITELKQETSRDDIVFRSQLLLTF